VSEFWSMGGYAVYVWGSYGATLAVFAWNLVQPRRTRSRLRRQLREERTRP
jgi:heme exporter protein CcmD